MKTKTLNDPTTRDYNISCLGDCDESNGDELFCETAGRLGAEAKQVAKRHTQRRLH